MAIFWKPSNLKTINDKKKQEQTQKEELKEVEDACLDLANFIQTQQTGIEEIQDALVEIAGMVANMTGNEG